MKSYLIKWTLFTLFCLLFFIPVQNFLPAELQMKNAWWVALLFAFITLAFHYGLMKARQRSGSYFVKFYMGVSALKLMLLLLIIIVYSLLNRANAASFIAHFFSAYMFYTVFEVWQSYAMLREKKTL
ncbi:MAG TPA: hypothetical protein PKH65_08720 [Bacteroidia bacterium]|nr:hypothetical protein [Bacteroidia bacterium]HNT80749.1 hypothetical protein [Bacteroidia bacterium]